MLVLGLYLNRLDHSGNTSKCVGRIYSEWFPSSGYEAVEGPEILWSESPDTGNPKYRSEIWIPVKKKTINYINVYEKGAPIKSALFVNGTIGECLA